MRCGMTWKSSKVGIQNILLWENLKKNVIMNVMEIKMYQKMVNMSDGDIKIRVNWDKNCSNQFNVWDDNKALIMLSLSLKEAESLTSLLGSAIQDFLITTAEGKDG